MGLEDHELARPDAVSPTLRCPICTDVFVEPVSCSSCQQVFCRSCIERAVLTCEPVCPTCRAPMTKDLQPNLVVSSLLNELQVRCVHPGCYWTGRWDERPLHSSHCLAQKLLLMQEWKAEMEDVRSMLIEREKEKRAMHQRIKELKDHTNQLEEEARVKQLQVNVKQSLLDFKQQEVEDLRRQLGQVIKQQHASHFHLHSLFPLLFLLLFVIHLFFFYDTLPRVSRVLGIRECLFAT